MIFFFFFGKMFNSLVFGLNFLVRFRCWEVHEQSPTIFSLFYGAMYLSSLPEFCIHYSCQHSSINVNNFFKPLNVPIIDLGRWQALRTAAL